jgi:hypothetical protein
MQATLRFSPAGGLPIDCKGNLIHDPLGRRKNVSTVVVIVIVLAVVLLAATLVAWTRRAASTRRDDSGTGPGSYRSHAEASRDHEEE